LLRALYPAFTAKNQPCNYSVGYYFGKASPEEIEKLFTKLKTGK
jgi:hypothetical protein